jgi:hypothetical protein
MLRVRTALTGFTGAPGLMTSYFETPLQDAAAALRCVGYVHSVIDSICSYFVPNSLYFQTSGDVDVLTAATGVITDTLGVAAPAVTPGVGGASKAPPSAAALLKLSTATFIGGRRVRGRVFVSPLAAAGITADGVLGAAGVTALAGIHTNMAGALASGDTWVVWHRPKFGAGGEAAPITATYCDSKLAVLTSRRD